MVSLNKSGRGFSKVVFENKDKLDMGDKTQDEISKLISDPVYISKDKKTGKVLDKDPSVYFSVIYYSAKPANGDYPAMRERVANFEIPGMDDCLDLNALMSKSVTCIPTVKIMHLTKSGSKLSMKMYVTAAIVTDIEDIVKKEIKSAAYNKFSQNPALVEKMRKKMEKIKLESPTPKEEAPVDEGNQDPYVQTTPTESPKNEDFNLEDMLNSSNQPVMGDIDLDDN